MRLFRITLIAYLAVLLAYTVIVGSREGWHLLPVFFGDILAMRWPGQFNLDFLGFLGLSAAWVAWRHEGRPAGWGLAVLAFFGGMAFLAPYLAWASLRAKGDPAVLLLGPGRAAR